VIIAPPQLLVDRLGKPRSLLLAGALILAIAALDYRTGYAFRLGEFYLLPIALVAWVAGALPGILAASCASLLWLVSFESGGFYLTPAYYFWEAIAMLASFSAFAWLIARLKLTLTHADERFVTALEKMPTAIYVSDERSNEILYANKSMLSLVGNAPAMTPRDFASHFSRDVDTDPAPARQDCCAAFSAATVSDLRTGRWYLLHTSPIPWGKNANVQLNVLTDITDRKQSEMLREKHSDALHQAARMSSLAEIASSLAHEVNQPLMVIATYMDASLRLIEAGQTDMKEMTSVMHKCRGQAVRAASIIQRLRDFIRQRNVCPSLCDPRELVLEIVDLLKLPIEEARIHPDLSQLCAGVRFMADRILIIQLLDNLIRNAIEAMDDIAPSRRRLSISARQANDATVEITIADSGPGLAEVTAEQLFSPFFTTKTNGLGLGLAICRSIAEAHGGQIQAENGPDGGAVFTLVLPADGVSST
jgi:hypothetical protein